VSRLAGWLLEQLNTRGFTQQAAADHAGVSIATINDILRKDHIPKIDTLFRLADRFDTSRETILRLAAGLSVEPHVESGPSSPDSADQALLGELQAEFHKIPDAWKPEVIQLVATFARLANRPPARFVGEDPSTGSGQGSLSSSEERL
jgi:transcriptional regulator with XRE-family HTH domain